MADPVQLRAKEKRLAEALRANLKRRKEAARERAPEPAEPNDQADAEAAHGDCKLTAPRKPDQR